jgi:anti-sigma factor RsiW
MKSPCSELETLLLDRAAGSLDAAAAGRLEAHLAGCEACRAEAASLEAAIAAARLAPPSEAELRALERAQAATLRHWRGAEGSRRNRSLVQGFSAGFAVAAAAAVLVVAPGAYRARQTQAGAVASAVPEAAADPDASDEGWEPDLDAAWEVAALATDVASASEQLDSSSVDSDLTDE